VCFSFDIYDFYFSLKRTSIEIVQTEAKIRFFHGAQQDLLRYISLDREKFSLQTYICLVLESKNNLELDVAFLSELKEKG